MKARNREAYHSYALYLKKNIIARNEHHKETGERILERDRKP